MKNYSYLLNLEVKNNVSRRQKMYLEPLLINHLAGVECTHGVYLHYCLEGIEGEWDSRAEEISSSICQKQIQNLSQN